MLTEARAGGGGLRLPEQPGQAVPELVRADDEVGRFDNRYVGAQLLNRWGVLVAWAGLFASGLLPMHPLAFAGSAAWIALTNIAATWSWFGRRRIPLYDNTYLLLDSLSVAFGTLATANLSYPIWLAFVLVMTAGAAELTTRFSVLLNAWCLAAYLACAGIIYAAGWSDPEPGVVGATVLIMFFVTNNLTITFDGNRRLRSYIRRMSVTDPLTGLANRRRLNDVLGRDPDGGQPIAVAVFDVDNFKHYNDSLGHLAGDRLLVRLARCLEAEFADAHTISRYGGDEFVVLLPCNSPEAAAERVQKLVSGDTVDPVPVSIGLAVWPHHEATLDATLAAADDCLRAAKRTKKGTLVTPGA